MMEDNNYGYMVNKSVVGTIPPTSDGDIKPQQDEQESQEMEIDSNNDNLASKTDDIQGDTGHKNEQGSTEKACDDSNLEARSEVDIKVHKCSIENPSPSKKQYLFGDEMKFMENFDPSERLHKKKSRKFTEFGVVEERCDCLIPTCPGCHYPCNSCGSGFCGEMCRKGRDWSYDLIEVQGHNIIRTRIKQE